MKTRGIPWRKRLWPLTGPQELPLKDDKASSPQESAVSEPLEQSRVSTKVSVASKPNLDRKFDTWTKKALREASMVKLRKLFPKNNNLKQNAELKYLRSLEKQGVSLDPRQQKLLL